MVSKVINQISILNKIVTIIFLLLTIINRNDNYVWASAFVIFHAFLAHFDGIVAKVHQAIYPNDENPQFNRFLIAFCNKIVNILTLFAILQEGDFDKATLMQMSIYYGICYLIIAYDLFIGAVHVQSYFTSVLKG